MYYIGVDLGKQSSYVVVQNSDGHILSQKKVLNDPHRIEAALKSYRPGRAVIEATSNYYWMHGQLTKLGFDVILAHPLKVRAIADAKVKNDRIDATILAHLLRANLVPESYVAPENIRALREITRQHIRLTRIRTRIKNQGHALLTKLNMRPTEKMSDTFGKKGRLWLESLDLSDPFNFQKHQILQQVEFYNKLIYQIDKKIFQDLKKFPEADKLKTIPGIGGFSAALILAEIGDVHRFPSAKQLVGYAGMTPGLYASGQTYYTRSITHQGSKFLRWILCEVTQKHILRPGPLRNFYLRLKEKKGHGKALMATARKLLVQVYYTLTESKMNFAG